MKQNYHILLIYMQVYISIKTFTTEMAVWASWHIWQCFLCFWPLPSASVETVDAILLLASGHCVYIVVGICDKIKTWQGTVSTSPSRSRRASEMVSFKQAGVLCLCVCVCVCVWVWISVSVFVCERKRKRKQTRKRKKYWSYQEFVKHLPAYQILPLMKKLFWSLRDSV